MLGKVFSGIVGSTIAAQAGKSGALGAVAGVVINRVVRRSPVGAMVIGGIWVGSKLYKRRKQREERKFEAAALAAKPVKPADPATPPPASSSASSASASAASPSSSAGPKPSGA